MWSLLLLLWVVFESDVRVIHTSTSLLATVRVKPEGGGKPKLTEAQKCGGVNEKGEVSQSPEWLKQYTSWVDEWGTRN